MLALPGEWQSAVAGFFSATAAAELAERVTGERAAFTVYPPEEATFRALELLSPASVKVVILGQDPYHEEFQAEGLAFSVPEGVKIPPSLRNIFKELQAEYGWDAVPQSGELAGWAEQGVLLLNSVLTVRAHHANSHQNLGWEAFTDAVIRAVNQASEAAAFLLWGAPAQKKRALIDETKHGVFTAPHPSPLSAYRGFFGSNVFRQADEFLRAHGRTPIDWRQTLPKGN